MAGSAHSIYVEILIASSIERVWQLSQTPELHERWDLRFTEIKYLPRDDPSEPQRFLYATRIGFGLNISGQGESAGNRDGVNGERSSALSFWSDDPKSLIREGSGYWKYVPAVAGGRTVRFFTAYNYVVRFGALGRLFDRIVFRPLIGWATAWSFDRLRLWIEEDIDPAASIRQSLIYATARLTLAFIWLYHGIIPKLVFQHPGESVMLRASGLSKPLSRQIVLGAGWMEVLIGASLILLWRSVWPLRLTLVLMAIATAAVATLSPTLFAAPFNPATFNLSVFALAAIACLSARDLPSAANCLREPPNGEL